MSELTAFVVYTFSRMMIRPVNFALHKPLLTAQIAVNMIVTFAYTQ